MVLRQKKTVITDRVSNHYYHTCLFIVNIKNLHIPTETMVMVMVYLSKASVIKMIVFQQRHYTVLQKRTCYTIYLIYINLADFFLCKKLSKLIFVHNYNRKRHSSQIGILDLIHRLRILFASEILVAQDSSPSICL